MGIMSLFQGCTSSKYITAVEDVSNKIIVSKTEFTTIKEGKPFVHTFILIKSKKVQFPIVLYKITDDEYKALLLECTHQGCELTPYTTTLVCPCHGAEFNTLGEVTQGPADTALKSFSTTQDNERVYIQL